MRKSSGLLCLCYLFASFAVIYCDELPDDKTVLPEETVTSVPDGDSKEDVKRNSTFKNSEELYRKAHSYLRGTKAFKHFTYEVRMMFMCHFVVISGIMIR